MTSNTELVAVIVTDKNGRTSVRRKKPENIKPTDVLVDAPKKAAAKIPAKATAKTPTKKTTAASKTATTPKKPVAKKPVAPKAKTSRKSVTKKPVELVVTEALIVETPKPSIAEIIEKSGIAQRVLESALAYIPVSKLVDSEVTPTRVNIVISDIFGYESELSIDFTENISVTGDKAVVDRNRQPSYFAAGTRATYRDRKVSALVRGWRDSATV